MSASEYEGNRLVCSAIGLIALLFCMFGSWIAFGVFAVSTAEYIATMVCEAFDRRPS